MATGSRTLKLSILAETKQLTSNLQSAEKDVQGFGDKIGSVGKKVGLAFAAAAAAAAAYAVKIGIDGVKSAIEDEAAQLRLANALKTATGATDSQIKATENYISKMQLATGVSDTELRGSMQRLSVSTKDVGKSQDLLNLALDVSKGTGKDLATVTEALAKSYEGQDGKLAKLGIGLSAADLKAMDFTETQKTLSNLYGGAASKNAETFQGRIDRLKQAFDETKESIGQALLPILDKLLGLITTYILPVFVSMRDALGGGEGFFGAIEKVVAVLKSFAMPIFEAMVMVFDKIRDVIIKNKDNFEDFFDVVKAAAPILGEVWGVALKVVGTVASVVLDLIAKTMGSIKTMLNFVIDGINLVIRGLNLINPLSDIPYIGKIGQENFTGTAFGQAGSAGSNTPFGQAGSAGTAGGTPGVSASATLASGGSSLALPSSVLVMPKVGAPINSLGTADVRGREYAGSPITVNIGVAGDPEATARVITETLNNSFYRGTRGAGLLEGIA
jgi:hypothetical protein